MEILDNAKNLLHLGPIMTKFIVNNPFPVDATQVEGKLQLVSKTEAKIEKIIAAKPSSARKLFFCTPFFCTINAAIEPANNSQARVGAR